MKGGGEGNEGEEAPTGGKGDMARMTTGGRKKTGKIVTEPVVKGLESEGKRGGVVGEMRRRGKAADLKEKNEGESIFEKPGPGGEKNGTVIGTGVVDRDIGDRGRHTEKEGTETMTNIAMHPGAMEKKTTTCPGWTKASRYQLDLHTLSFAFCLFHEGFTDGSAFLFFKNEPLFSQFFLFGIHFLR